MGDELEFFPVIWSRPYITILMHIGRQTRANKSHCGAPVTGVSAGPPTRSLSKSITKHATNETNIGLYAHSTPSLSEPCAVYGIVHDELAERDGRAPTRRSGE